jgi:uncharacterized membrane protein HdeD (DUF308 family)
VIQGRTFRESPNDVAYAEELTRFTNLWWSLAVRGLLAILLGLALFAWRGISEYVLVLTFGGYTIVDGMINIAGAWRAMELHERSGAFLLEALAGIVAGSVAMARPGTAASQLVHLVAAWSVLTGLLEAASALRLREYISGEWRLGLSGFLSLIFGIALIAAPVAAEAAPAVWIGIYALAFGIVMVALGFRLRSWRTNCNRTFGRIQS